MTRKKSIHALALETIGELQRRGWMRSQLADAAENTPEADTCSVCLIGAVSSAYNNFNPYVPGYGHNEFIQPEADDEGDYDFVFDKDYRRFMLAVAKQINPGLAAKRDEQTISPADILYSFNDSEAENIDDVISLLQEVADKHAPKRKAAK